MASSQLAPQTVAAVAGTAESLAQDEELTVLWTLVAAFFVFYMQCGFALLESGAVRVKNVKNILLKNIIDACISTLCWWAVGWAFAYGSCDGNGFIGTSGFFASDASPDGDITYWSSWLFAWAFSATATTVVSGAVAERLQFKAYVSYTIVVAAFVYPVVVHWVWSNSGWLSARRQGCGEVGYSPLFSKANGLVDFAGSGVVHMVGGGAALLGAIVLGPRLGRFNDDGTVNHFEPASPANMCLGMFILWLGWYGFNAGSTGCFRGCMNLAAKVAVNTTLSVGSCALTCLLMAVFLGEPGDIAPLLNGVLAGAVSITASCALVQTYAAVIIGVVGALFYTAASHLLLKLKIDDPLDAAPVHFFCGSWGLLAVGFFATENNVKATYGYANDWGVFYGGKGYQLGLQLLGIVVIAAWSCGTCGALFLLLKKFKALRVPAEVEVQGLDLCQGLTGHRMSKYKAAAHLATATTMTNLPTAGTAAAATALAPRPSMSFHVSSARSGTAGGQQPGTAGGQPTIFRHSMAGGHSGIARASMSSLHSGPSRPGMTGGQPGIFRASMSSLPSGTSRHSMSGIPRPNVSAAPTQPRLDEADEGQV